MQDVSPESLPTVMRILGELDPNPVIVRHAGSRAPFLITCDHAGRAVPKALHQLGLPPGAFERHIAWDIGAGELSLRLGEKLGACVIQQAYSRLVIDSNRAPGRSDSIPSIVDETEIPGNLGLSESEAAARVSAIHTPYHQAIADELDWRESEGLGTIVLFLHSFTPRLAGRDRPWTLGVLHAGDSPFSDSVLAALRREHGDLIGDNQPYILDETDYSAARHARARGHDYLELEVRQDLLADAAGIDHWATRLTPILEVAHSLCC
jgi:predicted N-formylglutamate amidohydrolase